MFPNNRMKYKIAFWKGKTFCCRICIFNHSSVPVVRHIDGKFKIIKLNLLERIREFIRK